MRIAYWMPTATNTRLEYLRITTFHLQQRLHGRASMLHYRYIVLLINKTFALLYVGCYYATLHYFAQLILY